MKFEEFFDKCRTEPIVSDFESYLAQCIFEKKAAHSEKKRDFTVETYSHTRDLAFERRDEKAARLLYDLARVADWKEGEWEDALR